MQVTHKLVIVFLLIGGLALHATMPFAKGQLTVPAEVTITAAPSN